MRYEAIELTLEHAKTVYEDLADTWRDIERKAQGNIAIAGIFIASSSLIYRTVSEPTVGLKYSFLFAVFCLTISVVLSVLALFVSTTTGIEFISEIEKYSESVISNDKETDESESYRVFLLQVLGSWKETCESLREANNKKSTDLQNAQVMLLIGILCVCFVVYIALQ